jgi:hypothetical protein
MFDRGEQDICTSEMHLFSNGRDSQRSLLEGRQSDQLLYQNRQAYSQINNSGSKVKPKVPILKLYKPNKESVIRKHDSIEESKDQRKEIFSPVPNQTANGADNLDMQDLHQPPPKSARAALRGGAVIDESGVSRSRIGHQKPPRRQHYLADS